MKSQLSTYKRLAIMVVGLMCFVNASATDGLSGIVGDVTGDGRLNINDVVSVIDHLLKEGEVNVLNDVNGDGQLTISDITKLIDIILDKNQTSHRYAANGVAFDLVIVREGTFTMGATNEQTSEATYDEYPKHHVTLSTYSIGKTQVTQELWEAVMDYNPSGCVIDPLCPVECVSWDDCQEFIENLNELTGCSFRLPTEAEWEYAARGGNKSRQYKYSGSNDYDLVAWCELNSGDHTQPVGSKRANELGIYDMSGNVWEWCQDWWGEYSVGDFVNPTGPESGDGRVCRGGCMMGHVRFCRVSCRMYYPANYRRIEVGLRLAM